MLGEKQCLRRRLIVFEREASLGDLGVLAREMVLADQRTARVKSLSRKDAEGAKKA